MKYVHRNRIADDNSSASISRFVCIQESISIRPNLETAQQLITSLDRNHRDERDGTAALDGRQANYHELRRSVELQPWHIRNTWE